MMTEIMWISHCGCQWPCLSYKIGRVLIPAWHWLVMCPSHNLQFLNLFQYSLPCSRRAAIQFSFCQFLPSNSATCFPCSSFWAWSCFFVLLLDLLAHLQTKWAFLPPKTLSCKSLKQKYSLRGTTRGCPLLLQNFPLYLKVGLAQGWFPLENVW